MSACYASTALAQWRPSQQHLKGSQKVDGCAGLFVLTCQSNITGIKVPIDSLTSVAKRHGFSVLLDASAYLPSSPLSLRTLKNRVDAVGLSVYKIAGFPTGVGALVVRKDFLRHLGKRGFAGGSVDVVQAPGELVTYAEGAARFEDGTPVSSACTRSWNHGAHRAGAWTELPLDACGPDRPRPHPCSLP